MTLFDTHAHYYDEKFGSDSERREVIGKNTAGRREIRDKCRD